MKFRATPSQWAATALLTVTFAVGLAGGAVRRIARLPFDRFAPPVAGRALDFDFRDRSGELPFVPYHRSHVRLFPSPAWVSAGDIDGDGRDDLVFFFENESYGMEVHALLNRGGRFEDRTKELGLDGLAKLPDGARPLAAVLVDLENKGRNDLVVTTDNSWLLVFPNLGGKFGAPRQRIALKGSDGRNLSLADVDRDGFVDIVVGGYFATMKNPDIKGSIATEVGGRNILFRNRGGTLSEDPAFFPGRHRYTWAIGASDFDGDGFPDFYEANDFGFDRIFANRAGTHSDDVTETGLGHLSSRSSMSAETADVHNRGKMDVYVTDMPMAGLWRGRNYLWQNESEPGRFAFHERALDLGIDSCGFAWGAKFFDFDRDGALDLFVVNSPYIRDDKLWRNSALAGGVPEPFRSWMIRRGVSGIVPPREVPILDSQRNCVFHQKPDGTFEDLTASTSLRDEAGGRGLALLDPRNDGNCAFAVANENAAPGFFACEYKGRNGWIGFRLQGTKSNRNAIGARVTVETTRGRYLREVAPTSGYQAQSTLRLLFGIPAGAEIHSVTVSWPSGKSEALKTWRANAYNDVVE